ncbi:ChrR cupin-like domain protein [Bordetella bronchiseptica MBORD681]|uniref:cupin domain-containing protein n=1 Tax=Bordetella bronchiseptica TaxID=518 RepID=UPI000460CF2A|nr:cupin domain-containing protein [Bordetella bronchiseptica]KDD06733.1 ChrR cupin-like domain protein [Bordetella bronchiseptica MBORD698]KDD09814.1 ChrR cupin-like domain protein [Bordetella bronchiseptica MBORD681]
MSDIDPITSARIVNPGGRGGPLTEAHQPMRAMHRDDIEWENLRYEGQFSKMMFHPVQDDRTIPNAGIVRYEKGSGHPLHNHYFAQIWYVLSGKFEIEGKVYGEGSMMFHPDPHYEYALNTLEDGEILYVQYMGPTTRQPAIYEGRFNMETRRPLEDESTAA